MRGPGADARRRLSEERTVWCATVRPDGSPHLSPVWFVLESSTWWVATPRRSVKVANLRRNPQAAFALPDPDRPLVAQGSARIHTGFPAEIVAAFAAKYDGWDITSTEPDGARVLIEVGTDRWLFGG